MSGPPVYRAKPRSSGRRSCAQGDLLAICAVFPSSGTKFRAPRSPSKPLAYKCLPADGKSARQKRGYRRKPDDAHSHLWFYELVRMSGTNDGRQGTMPSRPSSSSSTAVLPSCIREAGPPALRAQDSLARAPKAWPGDQLARRGKQQAADSPSFAAQNPPSCEYFWLGGAEVALVRVPLWHLSNRSRNFMQSSH